MIADFGDFCTGVFVMVDDRGKQVLVLLEWRNFNRLENQLPDEYKNTEYLIIWDPHDVSHRIETEEYRFPYRDLILYNRYTPRSNTDKTWNSESIPTRKSST